MDKSEKDVCSIRIMFPVDSDEQAFDCRKKIQSALSGIPDTHTDFRIVSGRLLTPLNPNGVTR